VGVWRGEAGPHPQIKRVSMGIVPIPFKYTVLATRAVGMSHPKQLLV
jgi:hypothetical protein